MAGVTGGVRRAERVETAIAALPGFKRLVSAGEMGLLAARVLRIVARPPFPWAREAVIQGAWVIRVCLVPLVISAAVFSLGMQAVWFGGIIKTLGTIDRLGGAFGAGSMRETQVWITLMIIAGGAGSAMCADLGARKVREELDAVQVLGLGVDRFLVAPRIVGIAIAAPILGLLALLVNHGVAYAGSIVFFDADVTAVAFRQTFWAFMFTPDVLLYVSKMVIVGALIGVVACHKGCTAAGGTEGVGRAVNQCVLITFFGAWFVASLLNLIFYSMVPDVLVLRG